MKQYKRKKELKALKKQNNMFYSIANKSGSRREIKKIKKIWENYSKKSCNSSGDSSSDKFNSDS